MPQSVFIQVGQCGNQVGYSFWESIVKEYSEYRETLSGAEMEYFLKPKKDMMTDKPLEECYNARAVLIDMEEAVVNRSLKGELKQIFQKRQLLTDVSGSGNNWAVGHKVYGQKYHETLINMFRKEAEECDKLESFLLAFSIGGGTGSGLGTAALEKLESEFPKIPRCTFVVFPSSIDDVITSPYNAVLANSKLAEHASCIIPFENQILTNICMKVDKNKFKFHPRGKYSLELRSQEPEVPTKSEAKPFNDINNIISSTISDFTSCSRLPGALNTDINDIIMNVAPYPQLTYLVPSCAPFIIAPEDSNLERLFTELFTEQNKLFDCDFSHNLLLSAAVFGRGKLSMKDLQDNINRMSESVKFANFVDSTWKLGLCNLPTAGRHCSILKLVNTTAMAAKLQPLKEKFMKMYAKQAHLHHFSDVESNVSETFDSALGILSRVIGEYERIKKEIGPRDFPRINLV